MFIDVDASKIHVSPLPKRPDRTSVERLAQYPVALIGDTQDRMGMLSSELRPRTTHPRLAGSILPIYCREGDNLAVHRALEEIQPGDVLVINAMGETTRAIIGGLIAEAAALRGAVGIIIDGSVRDIEELDAIGLPVYSRGVSPAGPYKFGPGSIGEAVACGRVVCHPGHVIIGDSDGLIVLPPSRINEIADTVENQENYEKKLKAKFRTAAI